MELKYSFKMAIDPNDLLNQIDASQELRQMLEKVDLVVSLRDIAGLYNREYIRHLSLYFIRKDTLDRILGSAPNGKGEHIYEGAHIECRIINPRSLYSMQTFALYKKILGLGELYNDFLFMYNILGLSYTPPFIVVAETKDQKLKLLAIYSPPIVEATPSHRLEPIFENIYRMIDKGKNKILLKKYDGTTKYIDLEEIAINISKIIGNNNIVIDLIRDGTHRVMLAQVSESPLYVVYIKGKEIIPGGAPILIKDVIITSEKPESKEDRFPGYSPEFWIDLKSVGIDG